MPAPQQKQCNLCLGESFTLVKSTLRDEKHQYKVHQCTTCHHIQLLPKSTEEEDKIFYDNNQQDKNRSISVEYNRLKENQLFDTKRHADLVESIFPTSASILDIGSGYGFFVAECQQRGYAKVHGLEISSERRNFALEHFAVDIQDYDISAGPEQIGRYDVITLFHVLEHCNNPINFLGQVKSLLNPGGYFICEVPNVNDLLLKNSPEYNDFYWIRAHLNYFSKDTLLIALNKAGFIDIETKFVQRYGLLNLANWLTLGKPQIDRPIFDIAEDYRQIEGAYRKLLEDNGQSDAIIAISKNSL